MTEQRDEHEHRHGTGHGLADGHGAETAEEVQAFWEDLYRAKDRVWSGEPNAALVREVADLAPGTALDLGCGEGGDAVWLARQGWDVVAVDVATEALARTERHAAEAEVGDRIRTEQHDLSHSGPEGPFDLVSAQFLQSPVALDRVLVLRRAAAAVAPGGTLVVVGHAEVPPWSDHDPDPSLLPSAETVLALLDLGDGWAVDTCEPWSRPAKDPDGNPAHLVDSVVRVHRTT